MTKKTPDLPPEVLNKLMRSDQPLIADLQGPGPFQLPTLKAVESLLAIGTGHLEIRLETELGQEVRVVLTEEAAARLNDLIGTHFAIQARDAKGRKN